VLPPNITILLPLNTTYNYNTSIPLNYTISGTVAIDKCWYNLDGGSNSTLTNCGNITFNTSWTFHKLYLYANDTSNNNASASVNFTVADNTTPTLSIQLPLNTTYNYIANLPLNYTVSDNVAVDKCWYNLNGFSNTTLSGCNNITFDAAWGDNILYLFANDTFSNIAYANISFTVTDDTPPVLTLLLPLNATYYYNISLPLNYIVIDNNIVDRCWYNLDDGDNITLTGCSNIVFNTSWASHNLYLFANDSANNIAYASINFTVMIEPLSIVYFNATDITLTGVKFNWYVRGGMPPVLYDINITETATNDTVIYIENITASYYTYRNLYEYTNYTVVFFAHDLEDSNVTQTITILTAKFVSMHNILLTLTPFFLITIILLLNHKHY
jgi:hypothetical protein